MTAQKGKDLLLKVDSTGTGSFGHRGGLAGPHARLQRG
jgi:predicted secreted protein